MENYQTITSFVFISLRFLTASLLFHFDGGSRSWITSSVMVLTQAAVVFSHSMDFGSAAASSDGFKLLQDNIGTDKSFS